MVVDPMGKIIAEGGSAEEIIYCDIDLAYIDKVRARLKPWLMCVRSLYLMIKKLLGTILLCAGLVVQRPACTGCGT